MSLGAILSLAIALLAGAGGADLTAPDTSHPAGRAEPPPRSEPTAPDGRPDRLHAPIYAIHPAVDVPVLAASALVIVVPSLLASEIIDERCPCDPSTVNRFDRGAIGNHDRAASAASDLTLGVAMAAPVALELLWVRGQAALLTDLVIYAEVLLVNGALVEIAKYTVQRPLPRTYAGDPNLVRSAGGYRSFYSGHTAGTFAALSFAAFTMGRRTDQRVWPWFVVAGVGASVAVERVAAGWHFPTDVIAGAVMGTLVGVGVPWLHLRHDLAVVPVRGGVGIAGRF
ncbi:phosphatase PAP2 family protein [Anaeromyxobacter oryzisoli]|uniref:phosphatase PAP2 family protein n=1 Tax=Anaeromyxobacter oryzisoli TaxID=2925408 RepID=UPI001F577DEC|nr:phosphatase PAP2 family protein [Anaeromyxobacter sp. SG63]